MATIVVLGVWATMALPSAAATPAPAPTATDQPQADASDTPGYWLVAADGGIFAFGDAGYYGSTGAMKLNQPVVGMAATPDGKGYWLVAADGGIFAFGDAGYYGSTGAMKLNQPVVGMAATPDGKGYWLVAADGGIFAFGDAGYDGSTGAMKLNQPVVGMAATPDGKGYWLVAADGGIFAFGDAGYDGSTGATLLNRPIVGMAATPDGKGYWLVASDGGIFTFGDASYLGSAPSAGDHVGDIVAIATADNGQGYWLTGSDGGITSFGGAAPDGSTAGVRLNRPIVDMAAAPELLPGEESAASVSITTTTLPNAEVGVPYSASLSADGGTPPYSWAVSSGSLPAGLDLSSSGTITGTPSGTGTSSFTAQVAAGTPPDQFTATSALSLTVTAPPLSIVTSSLPNATVGTAYSVALTASGGVTPYEWELSSGSLPAGLSLSSSGIISGAATGQGTSRFSVQVTDSTSPLPSAANVALSITVFPATVATSTSFSSNWSGYVELNGPFTEVTGTFSVPSLFAGTPRNDQMTAWVGIDGGNGDGSLIQAGFNETPDPSDTNDFLVQPWWEILPASETFINSVQIRPGDEVTVGIGQISGTQWGITLTDTTNGESFTTDQTYTGPAATAEWIVEALTENGQVTTLAPYSPAVNFSNLKFFGSNTRLEEVIMVQDGNQVSTPSALTANGFNVAYGAVAPSPP